jgi:hypothetical protein
MLRIPHCLDYWLTDGDKVVSPTHRPRYTPQKHYFSASGNYFCYRLSKSQGLVRPERLGQLKNSLISSRIKPVTFRLAANALTTTLPHDDQKRLNTADLDPVVANDLPIA